MKGVWATREGISAARRQVPAQPSGRYPFLFLLQLDSTVPLHGAVAEISSPLGFSIPQPRQEVAEGARKATLVSGRPGWPPGPSRGRTAAYSHASPRPRQSVSSSHTG